MSAARTRQIEERHKRLEQTFSLDACERLTMSDQDYYRSHGHYVPPLAELLNLTRAALAAAEAREQQLREALREIVVWDGEVAARHGNVGVREFAAAALTSEEAA